MVKSWEEYRETKGPKHPEHHLGGPAKEGGGTTKVSWGRFQS